MVIFAVPASVLIFKVSKEAVVPIAPVKVSAPVPLWIDKLSVPPAPSIVEVNDTSPSLVVSFAVTTTVPDIVTGPVKVISEFAASAVSIVVPVKVIPSAAVIATLRISSAFPISPVIFTVSVVPPVVPALILTVSLLLPTTPLTVIAPPVDVIVRFAPLARFIVPPVKDKVSPAVSIVTAEAILNFSPEADSKVVVPSKL